MEPSTPNNSRDQHQPQVANEVHQGPQATTPRAEAVAQAAAAPVSQAEASDSAVAAKGLVLPPTVISRSDLGKCLREVETISEYFHQENLRGHKDQPLPTVGNTLESLAQANKLNLIRAEDRDQLKEFLTRLKAKAPSVHMSFPSEASDDFIGKLLEWFRREVHPYIVLNVGLQPELAAGCTLRTTNKFYDFSFRHRFEQSKQKLLTALETLDKAAGPLEMPEPIAAAAPVANQPQEAQ